MKTAEKKVRDAASALHEAIAEARAAGLHVVWPRTVHDLPTIAVSETKQASATVHVDMPEGTDPALAGKAEAAAAKAVDKTVERSK
jgi:nicotinamidase-related amidase